MPDKFKAINDSEGHLAGDACLRKIGQLLNNFPKRTSDFIARFGGEEFCAVLPDTPPEGAIEIAEKIRAWILDARISHPSSPSGFVTVSVGVASTIPSMGDSVNDLLTIADKALYEAKSNGRDRVEF
ncbi:GGDEF domain-containing protein [Acidithiobacillus marinus]|uniref:GGDEF domain-containing protein n=1 Tax=Acidithiobacillus marinus TaxID=187490 RepID=UPI001554A7BA|nr:GGDEF domain-containing protein [Acidithiobacillus marinus]